MTKLRDDPWAVAVGTFVLAFGDIEHATISLLGCLPECSLPKTAPQLPLATRISLLDEVLSRSDDAEYQAALKDIRRVAKMISNRNLIAHNAVWINVSRDGERLILHHEMVSARDRTKRLNLVQAEALAMEAHSLAIDLSNSSVDLMKRFVKVDE